MMASSQRRDRLDKVCVGVSAHVTICPCLALPPGAWGGFCFKSQPIFNLAGGRGGDSDLKVTSHNSVSPASSSGDTSLESCPSVHQALFKVNRKPAYGFVCWEWMAMRE